MLDHLGRTIRYLRISVTDRCNFRCTYCMPPEGLPAMQPEELLTDKEILRLIACFSRLGIQKVRLTGGEPLLRPGIQNLVQQIKANPLIREVALTTNGSLLAPLAKPLKQAGLDRVNISLDTGNTVKFKTLTRVGQLEAVMSGVETAAQAGLKPIKINAVLTSALDEQDLHFFATLLQQGLYVRFIEVMPLGSCLVSPGLAVNQVKEFFSQLFQRPLLPAVESAKIQGPARSFRIPGVPGQVGFITPMTDHFCASCNRIRITADGKLRLCLLSDQEWDLKQLLAATIGDQELLQHFKQIIAFKPEGHHVVQGISQVWQRKMSQIGG